MDTTDHKSRDMGLGCALVVIIIFIIIMASIRGAI